MKPGSLWVAKMRVCIHRGAKLVKQQDHRLTRLARLRRVAKSTRTVSWSARPAVAVLLAAADFESIVRRAIIALGHSPNADIQVEFIQCHGLDAYKRIWKAEVGRVKGVGLASVAPNWHFFFPLRHKVIHGEQGSTGREFATERVEAILSASSSIAEFALQHGVNLFQPLPVRDAWRLIVVEGFPEAERHATGETPGAHTTL
jgi:hypothetical protein